MGGILDKLDEWLRGLLIEGITGNLSGMFDTVNTKVGEIAGEVGQTPLAWNSGVFSMIRNLSETVIVPIAGVILTFVMCYELIQLVAEKNNLHDVDTWMFFKWIFKTFCAVLIVTNTSCILFWTCQIRRSAALWECPAAPCSGDGQNHSMSCGSNWLHSCRREVKETMKPTYKSKELLPLSVIDAARDGDSQAVDQVLRYYEGYINKLCTRTLYDPDGQPHVRVDEYMKRRLEVKLIHSIVSMS